MTPSYTVQTTSSLFTPSVEGSKIKATAGSNKGAGYINVTVNDGETTYTQRFGVAVTGSATGIQNVTKPVTVTNDDYYDLQGRKVIKPTRKGVYIQNHQKVMLK